ncbi:hypothetical protein DB30_04524 [Enhygromyxa salina]|uniref:Uncharacterized protein n=1 Tax=Enhygromyxa salina TaxID=215803 RepID=A0A0C2D8R0_9BACT|nr:hypothetical protein DB30_04524 [Enhygromyxa salina]
MKWTLLTDGKLKYEWGTYTPENMSTEASGAVTVGAARERTEVSVEKIPVEVE